MKNIIISLKSDVVNIKANYGERMTKKRFMIIGENYTNIDMPVFIICKEDDCCFEVYESKEDAQRVCDKLNNLINENEQLKQSVNNLKDTIIKITIAYQRKYDRNIVNLVHEIYEEDISDLIKELNDD